MEVVMVDPLGPWQTPSETLQPCDRHRGLCQYRMGDPALCDRCHRSWALILGHDGQTREAHEHGHDIDDKNSARDTARLAANRKASNVHPPS